MSVHNELEFLSYGCSGTLPTYLTTYLPTYLPMMTAKNTIINVLVNLVQDKRAKVNHDPSNMFEMCERLLCRLDEAGTNG